MLSYTKTNIDGIRTLIETNAIVSNNEKDNKINRR